jgi:hypothetical protein
LNLVLARNTDRLTHDEFNIATRNEKLHVNCRLVVEVDTIAADLSSLLGTTADAPQNSNKQIMPLIYSMDINLQGQFVNQALTAVAVILGTVQHFKFAVGLLNVGTTVMYFSSSSS